MHYRLLACLLIVFAALRPSAKATPTLEITGIVEVYGLAEYLEILPDSTGALSFDQISALHKHKFFPLSEAHDLYAHLPKVVWLKLKLRNRSNNERFLLSLGLIDVAEVYNSGTVYMKRDGMLVPYKEREQHFGRYPYVALDVFQGESNTLYIKTYNIESISIQNAASTKPYHKMKLYYYSKIEEDFNSTQYFLGLHTGVILIMVLYNFVVFLFIKDRSYLLYILALLFYLFASATLDGATFEYIWGNMPTFNLVAVRIFLMVAWIFYMFFSQSFLNTKSRMPVWHKAFYAAIGMQVVFLGLNLLGFWNNFVFILIIAFGVALTFIVGSISVAQKYRPAIYYMVANGSLVLVCLLIAMWGVGWIKANPMDAHLLQVGMTFQVLLFSAGLADRINIMRRKYEEQERNHRQLIEMKNAELEQRVTERTAELEEKHKALQEQKREILVQNEELEQQNEEISTQKDLIEAQKNAVAKAYKDIKVLKELGRRINSTLDTKEIILIAYEGISSLIESSGFGIGIMNREQGHLDMIGYYKNGEHVPDYKVGLHETDRLIVWSVVNEHDIFVSDYHTEYELYTKQPLKVEEIKRELPNSLIYIPLIIKEKVIGILMVQSEKKSAFTPNHFDILKSLAEYVAVGIDHARAYAQVRHVNDELNEKNTQIIDSLRYAQTIQATILTDKDTFAQLFEEFFVFYRPRDLVSGDFYWATEQDGVILLSVIDCTGHGVPGAFMSMVGHELLNEIVGQKRITDPAEILRLMHDGVRKALQQDKGKNDDGMDMSICRIVYDDAKEHAVVTFAGAKASMFYYQRSRINELRGDKHSIGGMQRDKERLFSNHVFSLKKGDTIYLSTDGFLDQHNEQRQKFGKNMFKETLEIIGPYPLNKQKQMLIEALVKHQGKQIQRDDITILGMKV